MTEKELLQAFKGDLTADEQKELIRIANEIASEQTGFFFNLSTVKKIMQSGNAQEIDYIKQYINENGIEAAIEYYGEAEELKPRQEARAAAMERADKRLKEKYTEHLAYLTANIEKLSGEKNPATLTEFAELYKKHITKTIENLPDQSGNALNLQNTEYKLLSEKFVELLEKIQQLEKKIEQTTDPIEADRLQEELEQIKYDILPTGSPLYLFNTALTYHSKKKKIPTTKNNTKQSDRHKEIEYKPEKSGYTITQTDKRTGERVEITLINADKMQGKGVKKCFAFLLTMSNKQHFSPVIGFSLQELVDRGMYKNLDTARVGLKNALDTLQNIKFSGTIKKGKRKEIKQAEAGVLFYHYKIKNNYVEVSVNENFNIEFIAAYYALFPQFAYSLSNSNAFDLCEYIFMQARQNTADIKSGGSFNISFKRIRELLALPTPEETAEKLNRKYKQYIITPILTAIEDIQIAATEANNTEFKLQAVYNPNYNDIGEFLEGYIQISFNGEIYAKLCEIAEKQEAKIAQAMAIKEKRLHAPKEKTDK